MENAVFIRFTVTVGGNIVAHIAGEAATQDAGATDGVILVFHSDRRFRCIAAGEGAAVDHHGGFLAGAAVRRRVAVSNLKRCFIVRSEAAAVNIHGRLIGLAGEISGVVGAAVLFIVDAPHSLIDTIIDVGSAADHSQTALDAGDLHTVFRRALDLEISGGGGLTTANGIAPSAAIAG